MLRTIEFNDISLPCITRTDLKEKPEDLYNVRYRMRNWISLYAFRALTIIDHSDPPNHSYQIFLTLCGKDDIKKQMKYVIFSNFSNVDFVSIYENCVPLSFVSLFENNELFISDKKSLKIFNIETIIKKIQVYYDQKNLFDFLSPDVEYFRYKLECIILTLLNMKPNRNSLILGKYHIFDGSIVQICSTEIKSVNVRNED